MKTMKLKILAITKKQPGFTMIELLIVMAIIGILSAIAYPAYKNSVRKGYRATAEGYLMDLAQRQQQYFTDNRAYATTVDSSGLNAAMPSSITAYYTSPVTISSGTIATPAQTTPPAFTITARAINSQAPDGDLKIDSTGARSPSDKW